MYRYWCSTKRIHVRADQFARHSVRCEALHLITNVGHQHLAGDGVQPLATGRR